VTEAEALALDELVGDVQAVIDGLGLERPIVGGASMGAAVSLAYALRRPDALAALVLATPALGPEPHAEVDFFRRTGERIAAVGLQRAADGAAAELVGRGLTPEEAQAAVAPWRGQDATSLSLGMRTVLAWRPYEGAEALRALTTPVSIVAVAGDDWHPLRLAEALHAQLPVSDLVVLGSVLELFTPGAVGRAMAGGLERVQGARAG
jgi:3-oxoadipate enol-lactonase